MIKSLSSNFNFPQESLPAPSARPMLASPKRLENARPRMTAMTARNSTQLSEEAASMELLQGETGRRRRGSGDAVLEENQIKYEFN